MFRFNLASDVHLDFLKSESRDSMIEWEPTAPNLLLGGDICSVKEPQYAKFFQTACSMYTDVYFILGNHCAYGTTWEDARNIAKKLSNEISNLHFLDNEFIEVGDNILLFGATLFSNVHLSEYMGVTASVSDFRLISDWNVRKHIDSHNATIKVLDEYHYKPKTKYIGLFHFAPYDKGVSDPKFEEAGKKGLNSYFMTDLSRQKWFKSFDTICSGHTHYSHDFDINGVRLISNQKGYPVESIKGFDATRVFKV